VQALPVILLLIFMVAGIYFLRDLLLYVFTRLLLNVRSSVVVALFCIASAVLVDVPRCADRRRGHGHGRDRVLRGLSPRCVGKLHGVAHDTTVDEGVQPTHRETLEEFRAFLRSLMMHAAVGTAIGGVMTRSASRRTC
jgi:NhaB family Na+:H+ antiporter